MKISSASKKVLASALSAAMVVAFAPTVAFGQVQKYESINVTFNTEGLTKAQGSMELGTIKANAATDYKVTLESDPVAGYTYTNAAKQQVTGWYYDANGDGIQSGTGAETTIAGDSLTINLGIDSAVKAGDTITLQPVFADTALMVSAPTAVKQAPGVGTDKLEFAAKRTAALDAGHTFRATVAKSGEASPLAVQIETAATLNGWTAGSAQSFAFDFEAAAGTDSAKINIDKWGAGTYTLTVEDMNNGEVMSSASVKVVEVQVAGVFATAKGGSTYKSGQTFLAVAGQDLASQLTEAAKEIDVVAKKATDAAGLATTVNEYTSAGAKVATYSAGAFGNVATPVKVAEGMSLVPVYHDSAYVDTFTFNGNLNMQLGVPTPNADYEYTISGPVSKTGTILAANTSTSNTVYTFGDAGTTPGVYTIAVTEVANPGQNNEKRTELASKSLTVTKVTFDLGDAAKWNTGVKDTTLVQANSAGNDLAAIAATKQPGAAKQFTIKADAAVDSFVGWSLDGKNIVTSADKIAEGTTEVTLKAVYRADAASKPTFTYANGQITLANTMGDGYDVWFTTNPGDLNYAGDGIATGKGAKAVTAVAVDPTKTTAPTVYAQIKAATTNKTPKGDSKLVTITPYGTNGTAVKNWADTVLFSATSDSTKTAPKYYSDVLKTTAADAKAAVEAVGYSDDWDAVVLAQEKAVLKAIADYEAAQIDAYVAGVKDAKGALSKLDADAAAKAKTALEGILTDVDYLTDKDAKTVATSKYYNAAGTDVTATVAALTSVAFATAANVADIVTTITKTADDAIALAKAYKAEDVTAAEAVAAQLAAAKTAAEAQAALEAYKALTSTQKELVSAADVVAAQEIVAAQELKDAQDDAAVSKARNASKTVKAGKSGKTTKKQSITLKAITSKSGAKVTYKKTSGKKAITVKSGKAYLAKGTKKGTYKATVTATCGTQTAKITVKFVVK